MKIKFMKRLGGSVSTRHGKTLLRSLPLMAAGLLACTLSTRAADSPGVKFNSGVRYSQWAIDSRLHDFYGNQKKFGFDYYDKSGTMTKEVTWNKLGNASSIERTFDYVAGLVGKATLEAADFYEGVDWSKPWFYAAQGYATGTPYSNSSMTLDNMNAAKMYLPILAGKLKSDAATTAANTAIAAVIKDMKTYNSTYSIGGSKSGLNSSNANDVQKTMFGGWFHKSTGYTDQMWCDGQYMGPALLAQIIKHNGKTNNISDNDWDIIAKQFSITWAQLYDSNTGLLYHGFAANPGDTNSSSWAGISKDNGIYHSASFWGRANAWYFLALVDILEAMPTDNTYYNTFKGYLTNLAAGIKNYQDSETGCWYQVLDKTPASLSGNYLEASCSSIFTAAYLKAIRLGLLDKATYESVAKKAYEGLVNQFVVYDNSDNSTVQLVHSCTSAGLGGSDNRAGDDNYYLKGSDAGVVTSADPSNKYYYTEGKVLGGFIMAATEYERAYQNQDNKQILFAKDLAPEYDFSTTEGTLDATAYGNGTVSYQWYKDGSPIADATSATYTPTESGTYKCTATANDATITTSEAKVTAKSASSGEKGEETTTLFEYTVPTSGNITTDAITTTGGTVTYQKSSTGSADGYKIDNSTKYIKVTLSENTLQVGDVVTVTINSKGAKDIVAKNNSGKSLTLNNVSSDNTYITYTVTSTDILSGQSTFYLYRNTSSVYVKAIKITRAGSDTPTTKKYAVTASVNPAEGGNMYIYNGDEELTSGAEVESGTNVKFSVSPNSGYFVTGWTVNGVEQNTTETELTVTVKEATTVVANVEQRFYVYCTTKSGGNSTFAIECNGKAVQHGATLPKGSTVKFTAIPAQGYKFVKWVNGENESEELGTSNPLVVESLSKDFNARAVFEEEGSGTVTTKTGTFSLEDLKTLDSTPSETEKRAITLNDGYVTVKAGTGINANDATSDGIKISKNGKSTFSIVANNGAKIKSITIEQDQSSKKLNYNPAGTESTTGTNTFKYDYSSSKPTEITVSYNTNGNIYVKSIIVEYETKAEIVPTQLTASFSSSTIDATEGDASVDLPTLCVKAGDADFTEYTVGAYTSNDDNVAKVENGKVVFGKAGNATISTTITPNDAIHYTVCDVEFNVNVKKKTVDPVDPTKTTVIYDFNSTVGTTTSYASSVSYNTDNTKMTFGSDFRINEKKYISIAPKDGSDGFKAGDIITLKGYCDSKNPSGIVIYNSIADGAESIFKTNALAKSTSTTGGSEYTFTLTEDCTNLYFGRFGGGNTYLTSLNVTRPASSVDKTRLTASFAEKTKVVVNTTTTVNLPALTVKAGETALTNEQYNVEYVSNATDVATISGDIITIKGEGTATITATITPVDAAHYEGTTATFQLTVKQPTQLNITVQDVTMNVTDANKKQPVINVYGDDDKLLKLGTDYTLSFSVKEGTNVKVDDAGTFTPAGNPYKWTEGTTTFTVKATPTESLGETYAIGTVDFTYNVIQGKLTPHFLEVFSGRNIKFYPDGKQREITVPLIYDYEDVSDYFDYTYTIDGKEIKDTKGISGIGKLGTKDKAHTLIYTAPTTEGTHTVVVSATPKTGSKDDGSDDYSNVYNTPATLSFTISVNSKYKRITIDLDPKVIDLTTGTSDGAPDVTVTYTDDKTVVPETEYVIAWTTNNESYARVNASTGHIEAVSEGQTKGRCLVTGENIESTTAFFTINVDDPAKYRVKSTGTYENQTVMWNQDRTMAVTLGGWMFPNNIIVAKEDQDKFGSEGLSSNYKWGGDKATSSQATWAINGEQYIVSGESQKNARQENGANALPETTTIYSADFNKYSETIKDPMFGVPCSGSYLVFNPAKPGVVSVDILQNGAFDKDNGKYQYRPQRRVFVMDEAGNFVKSEAVIGNANGKPLGKGNDRFTLSNYTWDITGKTPTMDLVNSHFNGLDNFEMSETGFKNNVYTSTLPQSDIPNQAAVNHKDEEGMESANGWAVLADGPVTYSFRVLPGKTYYLYNFGSKIGFYGFTFKEDETKPVVDNVEYDETSSNNIVKTTEDGHVATVSINRHIKQGIWNACVLPFSLNMHQVDAIFGATYKTGSENGTQILYFDHVDANGKVWFVRHAYNTIVANKPFLIKPTKDVETINTADCADYPYVTIEAPKNNKPADWCSDGKYAWVSSYNSDMTLAEGDGYIGGTSGSFIQSTKKDVKVKGFRGYLKGLTPEAKAHALSTATSSNTEENGSTTFIEGLTIDAEGNIVPVATDGKVYNINGQVVADGMKNLNALPSGVYIINGKKYVK